MWRKSRWIALWVSLCALLVLGSVGFAVSSRSDLSEAEANAQTAVYALAAVERRDFVPAPVSARGTLSLGRETDLSPQPSEVNVVTHTYVKKGDQLRSGDPVIEVSGQGVLFLPLPFPLYRDIQPGDRGRDVRGVQQALKDIGIYSGIVDGVYGARSEAAVRRMYRGAGLEPPQATSGDSAASAAPGGDQGGGSGTEEPPSGSQPTGSGAAGTPLPRAALLTVTSSNAQVTAVAPVGTVLSPEGRPAVSVRVGRPQVTARIAVGDSDAMSSAASITATLLGDSATALPVRLRSRSEFQQASSNDGVDLVPGYDMTFDVTREVPAGIEDQAQVRVAVSGEAAAASGLAVPLVAVREDSSGYFVDVVRTGSATPTKVGVTLEQQADGYALVAPLAGLRLVERDQVVVARS